MSARVAKDFVTFAGERRRFWVAVGWFEGRCCDVGALTIALETEDVGALTEDVG